MENNVTEQDLKKLIQESGLDIRELGKLAKQLKESGKAEATPKAPRSTPYKKPEYTWKVTLCKYPDFVVSKWTNGKREKQLVIMPSCMGYYIKNVDTGEVTALDEDEYSKFTSGMETLLIPKDDKDTKMWLNQINPGVKFFRKWLVALNNKTYCDMIKMGLAPRYEDLHYDYYSKYIRDDRLTQFEKVPKLYVEYMRDHKESRVCNLVMSTSCADFLGDLVDNFGIDNARDFLESLELSLICPNLNNDNYYCRGDSLSTGFRNNSPNGYRYGVDPMDGLIENDKHKGSPRPRCKMKYSAFKNYVLYQAVREGYALSMQQFFQTWKDTLVMELQYYGKIKEKYPEDLASYHHRLSYKVALNKQQIDNARFQKQRETTRLYEMIIDGYAFIAPESAKSFYEAATFLCNCLASYVDRYTNGATQILFMQKIDNPHELVAIEYVNDRINQAYQAHNTRVTPEQQAVLDKWFEIAQKIDKQELSTEKIKKLNEPVVKLIEKWNEKQNKTDDKKAKE